MLTLFRPKLTLSSPYVGSMVAYVAMQVRTPIAVTETTEVTETAGVGTGWGGGVFLLVYRLVESIYLLCLAVSRLKGV